MERYQRQLGLWGIEGQNILRRSHVLIAGCGGLGSVIATYLVCVGVGFVRLIDDDLVDENNLNRQFLHWRSDIGKLKSVSFKEKIEILNPDIVVEEISSTISGDSIEEIVEGMDLIVDALDNFKTRFIVNKATVERNIPLVHGAVQNFSGQVTTIIPGQTTCLHCIFPDTPKIEDFPIIGATCGVIGSIQATEVIKYIIGSGECLINRMLLWRGMTGSFDIVSVKRDPSCEICGSRRAGVRELVK